MRQPKMTRGIKIAATIVCCIIILGVSAFAIQREAGTSYRWGEIERYYQKEETPQSGAKDAIIGKHFTVSEDELARVKEVQMLIDEESAAEIAQNILIEKYALYYQAQQAGVVVTDEYLDQLIHEQIQVFESIPDNEEYEAFLDGIGMTNEEYWLSRKDELRITESVAAWKQLRRDEFIEENNYQENPPENLNELWEAHLEELVADIIEQEDIRIIN